ncbi:hypothetical protein FA13DRAFT_1740620 [Coprinellus micaceus]|uniref:Uncharacterized protein n=1 Tax=Coprinellus micaceus TaxID=71717 RepID=A0A4Y7SM49_COPMI|nr:hypothetical protein FA13DRAFT_1740620 [Coprinellus micaceus]
MQVASPVQQGQYTILRIKRKRNEEPLDALGMMLSITGETGGRLQYLATQSSRTNFAGRNRKVWGCSSMRRQSRTVFGEMRRARKTSRCAGRSIWLYTRIAY